MTEINIEEIKEYYQAEVAQLKKQLGSKDIVPYSFANTNEIEESMNMLEAMQSKDTSAMDRNSDVYRQYQNKMLKVENEVRIKLGLEPRSYNILESELVFVIQLGAVDEYISGLERHQQEEVQKRIDDIIFTKERNIEREKERLEFLDNISHKLERVQGYKPENYILDREGHMNVNRR